MTYYLAIDIGASSGRHILSKVENNKKSIVLKIMLLKKMDIIIGIQIIFLMK